MPRSSLVVVIFLLGVYLRGRFLIGFRPVADDLPELPEKGGGWKDLSGVRVEKIWDLPGPESIVVTEEALYTGLADGRIAQVSKDGKNWTTIARTCGLECPPLSACGVTPWDATASETRCGRPLGMRYLPQEHALIVADAYRGLLRLHLSTGAIEELTGAIGLANDLAVSSDGSTVYFTVTSTRYERRRIFYAVMEMRATGRLYAYDLVKNTTRLIAKKLTMPNGIEIVGTTALVVCGLRVLAFDFSKSESHHTTFLPVLPGTGDNVRAAAKTPAGEICRPHCFWFGLGSIYAKPFNLLNFVQDKPNLRAFLVGLLPYRFFIQLVPKAGLLAIFDADARLIEMYHDPGGANIGPWFSEAHAFGDFIYFGSWHNPYLARVPIADFSNLPSSPPAPPAAHGR